MLWNRIFEDQRPDDTIGEYGSAETRLTGTIDNMRLVAYGNGRWA